MKTLFFWFITLSILVALCYAVVETAVQTVIAPRLGTGQAVQKFITQAEQKNMTWQDYATTLKADTNLGWGAQKNRVYPAIVPNAKKILVIGDSVTAGHSVKEEEEYLAVLHQSLNQNTIFFNLAVNGYGVDQMLLKLKKHMQILKPDEIWFAYIPHNLIRPMNDFLYDLPKPKFNAATQTFTPAQPMDDLVQSYINAQNTFTLTPWLARRYLGNQAYYLPGFNETTYAALYHYIAQNLAQISQSAPVKIIRLTNYLPFTGQDILPPLWQAELQKNNLEIISLDDCTIPTAKNRDLKPEEEFHFHPHAAGHQIYAKCLKQKFFN